MKRRQWMVGSAAVLAVPALAQAPRPVARMTDGPFYPSRAWRAAWPDQDADLSRVTAGGAVRVAKGEHLGLELVVLDTQGRAIDNAEVEIWQCDVQQAYRHPSVKLASGEYDDGFQGFGFVRSGPQGQARLRTIRPVTYPGRTPHIHVKLRHPVFGEVSSQLFVAGDPGNARDFLWRSLSPADREALEMKLVPADSADGLRWTVRHVLTVAT